MKILIISPPRCGSTSLLRSISKLSDYDMILEPYMGNDPLSSRAKEKIPYPFDVPDNFIVKMITNQLPKKFVYTETSNTFFNFITSIYKDYDMVILLSRRNEKEHFESYVNLRIRNKNKDNPFQPWFFEDIENKLSTVLLNEITLYRTIINMISTKLSIPMIYYEDLYGDDRNKSLEIIKSWKLDIDNGKLNEILNPKFRYRQLKNKDII